MEETALAILTFVAWLGSPVPAILTFVGSLAGLATGIFTVYDRAIRKRPYCNLRAEAPDIYVRIRASVFLVIKNPGPRSILITKVTSSHEEVIVGIGEDLMSVGEVLDGVVNPTLIPPGEERSHAILFPDPRDDTSNKPDFKVTLRVYWHPVTGGFFRWRRIPLRIPVEMKALWDVAADAERRRAGEQKKKRG